MGEATSLTISEIYLQTHEQAAISTATHPAKVLEQFTDDVYSIL